MSKAKSVYEIGNQIFALIRELLYAGRLNDKEVSQCKISIEFPNTVIRRDFVNELRRTASISDYEFSRASAAQAGNNSGTWYGLEYELTVKDNSHVES